MKQSLLLLVILLNVSFFSCKDKPAQQQTETPPTQQFDFTIVPGERVGLITKDACSKEDVLAAYGDSARVDSVYLGEGIMDEGVVLFPDNPRRTAYIWWDKEYDTKHPGFIRILGGDMPGPGADWKTDGGIAIGTPIAEIEKQNGKPFDLFGFGWDYGGRVTDWKGGKFETTGLGLIFELIGGTEDEKLLGENVLQSNDPALLKAEPRVATLEIRFPVRETLPACITEKVQAISPAESSLIVKKMTVNGQDHYWFNDGAAAYDGIEYIYDSSCKEVCKTGGFRKPLECSKVYESGKWAVVWEEK